VEEAVGEVLLVTQTQKLAQMPNETMV